MHEDETVQRIRPLRHPPRIFDERSADRQAVAAPRLGGFRSAFQANRRARRAQADATELTQNRASRRVMAAVQEAIAETIFAL